MIMRGRKKVNVQPFMQWLILHYLIDNLRVARHCLDYSLNPR